MQSLQVLFEDNHIIAINKKVSDIVQGDKTGDIPLSEQVKLYLKHKYQKPGNVFVGVAHRLDRPTSGVVLFARTSKALARLNEMFREKELIQKTYWALVKNKPEKDFAKLEHYLVRDTKQNKSFVTGKDTKEAKQALLEYKLLKHSDSFFLLEIKLLTGRHHQIRAQLAAIGSPIKGDLKYGFPRSNPDAGISLHARSISFIHPVTKNPCYIIAPVPDEKLWKYFENNELPKNL